MTIIEVLLLSFVEGLTEFIPVSSTGHLILVSHFMGIQPNDFSKAFDVIIQFGAIFAVLVLYRNRLKWNPIFYRKLLLAFLPAAIVGFLFKSSIDRWLESTEVVAWALICGGVVMIFVDSLIKQPKENSTNSIKEGPKDSLKDSGAITIGLFQCLAMIPGVSRSAATIVGGQIIGLSRTEAAEFSFLLAVPTLAAATAYKLWKIHSLIQADQAVHLALGVFFSFLFSLAAIRFFISVVNRFGFRWFGVYRILLGSVVLLFFKR